MVPHAAPRIARQLPRGLHVGRAGWPRMPLVWPSKNVTARSVYFSVPEKFGRRYLPQRAQSFGPHHRPLAPAARLTFEPHDLLRRHHVLVAVLAVERFVARRARSVPVVNHLWGRHSLENAQAARSPKTADAGSATASITISATSGEGCGIRRCLPAARTKTWTQRSRRDAAGRAANNTGTRPLSNIGIEVGVASGSSPQSASGHLRPRRLR